MASDRTRLALFAIRDDCHRPGCSLPKVGAAICGRYADVLRGDTQSRIVSGACRRPGPALRDRHPDSPWREIMGTGNIDRPDYDKVAESFVWRAIRHKLTALRGVVVNWVARAGDAPGV
jgi:hypothetical protein